MANDYTKIVRAVEMVNAGDTVGHEHRQFIYTYLRNYIGTEGGTDMHGAATRLEQEVMHLTYPDHILVTSKHGRRIAPLPDAHPDVQLAVASDQFHGTVGGPDEEQCKWSYCKDKHGTYKARTFLGTSWASAKSVLLKAHAASITIGKAGKSQLMRETRALGVAGPPMVPWINALTVLKDTLVTRGGDNIAIVACIAELNGLLTTEEKGEGE